jgi:tetratricopeptide (TPR) repeat protein
MMAKLPLIYVRFSALIWLIGCVTVSMAVYGGWNYWGEGSPLALLAQARKQSANPTQALTSVRSAIRTAKGDFPAAQLFESRLLLDLKRGYEASNVFNAISRLAECDPDELCKFAERAQLAGELKLAARALQAAGKRAHRDPQDLKRFVYLLYTLQDVNTPADEILKLCQEYSQLAPDDPFPWLVSSSLFHEQGVPQMALNAYLEALKLKLPVEEQYRVRIQVVQLAMLLGNLPLAREQCNALLASSNSSTQVVTGLNSDLLQREGKPKASLLLLDKLWRAGYQPHQVLALRGTCHYDLNDFAAAIDDLSEAVRLDDFDQKSHYLLGQAYLKLNKPELAKHHLERSQELNDLIAKIFIAENQLRNDLNNLQLKLRLAELNEQRGDLEKAAAWRRGAEKSLNFP